jgi:signal transduction histidine kinase
MSTILIVDDNEQNLYMLQVLLQSHGHTVVTAPDGAQALAVASQAPPDLVITDILMPKMDGFALCRKWMADAVLRTKPLVFYTATYTDVRDEEFAMSLGAARFLIKPQEPEALLTAVDSLLVSPREAPLWGLEPSELDFLQQHNAMLFHKLQAKSEQLDRARGDMEREFALRRELESRLLQGEKMESLGRIASGIVHDFNNLLTVIAGVAQVVGLDSSINRHTAESMAKILDAIKVGSAMNSQLLAFARQQDLTMTLLDPSQLLRNTMAMLTPLFPPGVEVVLSGVEDLPSVEGDEGQLQRVFLNLATNARDAMASNGKLTIDACLMVVDRDFVHRRGVGQPGRYVRIRFQDTGSGMSPETLSRAFDPFFTTKKAARGTGLGLSVVDGIVHQHGGFLQVSSAVGRGTSVEILLPAITPQADATPSRPGTSRG